MCKVACGKTKHIYQGPRPTNREFNNFVSNGMFNQHQSVFMHGGEPKRKNGDWDGSKGFHVLNDEITVYKNAQVIDEIFRGLKITSFF